MASGITHSTNLADSLPDIIASARAIREFQGTMVGLSDRLDMAKNTGLDWNEISIAKLNAQGITETTTLDNPQALADTLFAVEPTMIGILTVITKKTMRVISANVVGVLSGLGQNAMQRRKNDDGLAFLDGATTSLVGAGSALTDGHLSAAAARVAYGEGNEPGEGTIWGVLHSYQAKDISDLFTVPVGTATGTITPGQTQDVLRDGPRFMGQIAGVNIVIDDNIDIDSADDAKGGVFVSEAAVLVDGEGPTAYTDFDKFYGGGADVFVMYDEFAWGERSAGNWLFEIYSDAATPSA